jgi:hypothetical protein
MPRILARLQLEGEIFLLTFPFIELQGGQTCLGPQAIWISAPLVNAQGSQLFTNKYPRKTCKQASGVVKLEPLIAEQLTLHATLMGRILMGTTHAQSLSTSRSPTGGGNRSGPRMSSSARQHLTPYLN